MYENKSHEKSLGVLIFSLVVSVAGLVFTVWWMASVCSDLHRIAVALETRP